MDKTYSIRPILGRSAGDTLLNHTFRVHMSLADMGSEGLSQGDYVSITSASGISGFGIAWKSLENEGSANKSKGTTFVRVSEFLRNLYGFELKDRFYISKWKGKLQEINSITISRIPQDEVGLKTENFAPVAILLHVQHLLCSLEGIAVGGTFGIAPYRAGRKGKQQNFRVEKIEPQGRDQDIMQPYVFDVTGKVIFGGENDEKGQKSHSKAVEVDFSGIVGDENMFKLLRFNLNEAQPEPILIVGAMGTGKSLILDQIERASWGKVLSIRFSMLSGSKLMALLNQFSADAASNQPALLLVDDLDELAPKQERSNLVEQLCQLIKQPENCHIRVVATAKRLVDIHQQLRNVFDLTFDLHLPTAEERLVILKQRITSDFIVSDSILQYVVDRTHAFTGTDLRKLWKETKQAITLRHIRMQEARTSERRADPSIETQLFLGGQVLQQDFDLARSKVHASAMNEIYIDVPKMSWSDIGGSDELKAELQQISKLTTRRAALAQDFGAEPVRGILMYGPPGCSKTLLARAFAAESRFNFINVKAQELISKYVGDTEHNIRELFRRARAAKPAAIFFDEFDSMAKRNTGHDSLNPVTALLTEMDGFEISTGVTVLAATNQPWLIDEALLRPGRFDKLCWVGPPDVEARKQILHIGTRRKPLTEGVDFQELARRTEGYSGAEVAEVCRIAARIGWEQSVLQKPSPEGVGISQEHFIKAIQGITPGITENMLQAFEQWRTSRSGRS